jgi:hypothetical protein
MQVRLRRVRLSLMLDQYMHVKVTLSADTPNVIIGLRTAPPWHRKDWKRPHEENDKEDKQVQFPTT